MTQKKESRGRLGAHILQRETYTGQKRVRAAREREESLIVLCPNSYTTIVRHTATTRTNLPPQLCVCVCPRLTIRTEKKKKAQQREKTNSQHTSTQSQNSTSPFSNKTAEWNQILSLPNSKNSICRGDGVIEMWSSVMTLHRHWLVHRKSSEALNFLVF